MTKVYSSIDKYNNIHWYKEGTNIRHRDDGPAIECTNGTKYWYQNGIFHRESGPALEFYDGEKWWCYDGKRHRIDGPAVEYENGGKEYWLNGKWYIDINTDEEWLIFQIIN